MKMHILRLGSVCANGVGGPEAGSIDLIYSCLLQQFGQDIYNHIHINQIGDDLNELIGKEGANNVYINIRYPTPPDFGIKNIEEKNRVRLEVVHQALLRIAEQYRKLDIEKLEVIKAEILKKNFSFDFVYKSHQHKKNSSLKGKVIINPKTDRFDFYTSIENNGVEKCKMLIYSSKTTPCFADFFFYGRWKGDNEFIITGKKGVIEIHVFVDSCSIQFVNLTSYDKPPYFELLRAGISKEDEDKAYRNWVHSMPPGIAAITTHEPN